MKVLVGDIGATKALLAVAAVEESGLSILAEFRLESGRFAGGAELIRAFRSERPESVEAACFGVAGTVSGGECRMLNLPWVVRERELAEALGLPLPRVRILNDFETLGYSLDRLKPGDLAVLQEGTPVPDGPAALLGAGTGLGEALVLSDGGRTRVWATEGGHADFAPRNEVEWNLREFLRKAHGGAAWERVLSGRGLADLYRYAVAAGLAPESAAVKAEMAGEDPAAVVTRRGSDGSDPACARALELFVSAYGAEAGNLALRTLATGGIYVGGGIAPRILPKLREGGFLDAFRGKDRMSDYLTRIPVRVILNPRAALIGAAAVALRPAPGR